MNFLGVILIFLLGMGSPSEELLTIRQLNEQAIFSSDKAEDFASLMEKRSDVDEAIILAYKGMSSVYLAKHGWNVFSKFDNFNKGKAMIEQAISMEPTNVELRYLRMTVQTNTPSVLGYQHKIEEDKDFIMENWHTIHDEDLAKRISDFMLSQSNLSQNERVLIQSRKFASLKTEKAAKKLN